MEFFRRLTHTKDPAITQALESVISGRIEVERAANRLELTIGDMLRENNKLTHRPEPK